MDFLNVKEQLDSEGYAVVEDFLTEEEVDSLRSAMVSIVCEENVGRNLSVFDTKKLINDAYFFGSGDKIRFFYEDDAFDQNGQLRMERSRSLNKVGHALHALNPAFKKVTFSNKVKNMAQSLGMEDPVVCQSMYIFKQPRIGGKVRPHHDSTYTQTSPHSLLGVWMALEDATLDNGCLWFVPGSQEAGRHGDRVMVRTEGSLPGEPGAKFFGTDACYGDRDFVPVPVKAGTVVLIHGEVVHKSEHNYSNKSREIYTFHMYDHALATYDKRNWLQPTDANTFCHLYSEC